MSKLNRSLLKALACAAMTLLLPLAAVHAGNLIVIVSGTKTVKGTFSVGGTVTYTVVLTNSGNTAQQDNPGNEFTDTLPAGLTLVSAVATSGTAATAANTVTWNGSIPANSGSVTITITATIDAGTGGQTISNQGTISYDSDANFTNNASAVTDDPGTVAASDPTSFQVAALSVRLQSFDVK